ncbi:Syntaxin-binding protein 5 [Trichinella pseudospiralis]|uniref:Syntaxin-binding protein 5 n=1 Tax=Trichinella pseudospiralis TaxID=6337 RepID=A0A0V0XMN2_TRIPS|nr:Syntaxin-binding protein 5 [Trichinella pseudospiralis]
MDKAGRKIRAAFEGLQSLWNNNQHIDLQSVETLTPEDFAVSEIACHGFPYQPTCLAYDPVQKLIAIGTQLGQPGVNVSIRHPNKSSVIQLQFIFNEGAVISLCSDCCIHMWNIRLKRPEIVHSLRFTREKLTLMYLPFQSNWLYLGTEKGNVHVVSIETFTLSGYVINWNKAIDMSQKHHPGTVVHLSECPSDDSKLLIGYECGTLVLWDLKDKSVDSRYQCMQRLRSACWHCDGKQFMCALSNGSLMTWTMKKTTEPTDLVIPLSKLDCKSFNSAAASGAGNTKLPEGAAWTRCCEPAVSPSGSLVLPAPEAAALLNDLQSSLDNGMTRSVGSVVFFMVQVISEPLDNAHMNCLPSQCQQAERSL